MDDICALTLWKTWRYSHEHLRLKEIQLLLRLNSDNIVLKCFAVIEH